MQKRQPKSSKNEMFVFGLHSISDDQPSDLLFQSGSSVVISIIVLVTLILSGGAVVMFHWVQYLHLGLTWLVVFVLLL